ncbi:outer membrane beta-barrel protein [Microbulbifer sp. SAOS-129_SWC]|uniref:outer membrane beta-barrel protein n=1 Tax=Microbulbifer sp. SAOS-129_SWC TaxID=3145235 RepID=UPI003217CCB8
MHNYKKVVVGVALAVMAGVASAQQGMDMGPVYRGSWTASGEVINFDPVVAANDGISDSGFGLGVGYAGEKGLFNFSVGATFYFIDDNNEFTQRVQNDLTGNQSTEKSSIDAGSLYVDAGLQYPLTDSLTIGLNGGYRYFDISRTISNCRDCASEGVSIDNDTYLKPFAALDFNERISGALAYYSYSGDKGTEDSLQFGVNFRF